MDVHPGGQERLQGLAGSLRVGDLGCSLTGPVLAAARAEIYGNSHHYVGLDRALRHAALLTCATAAPPRTHCRLAHDN